MIRVNLRNTSRKANNLFILSIIFATFLLLIGRQSQALDTPKFVEAAALFEGKAVLIIDGQQKLLREGESGPKGITLIDATPHQAHISIHGRPRTLKLGTTVREVANSHPNAKSEQQIIRAYRDSDGMFRKTGSINGYPVNFLIDTGASSIAMSEVSAKRLGINFKLRGSPIRVETAGGGKAAYQVLIDKVTIDGVTLNQIEGVVLSGNSPEYPLLGMSFLGRFTISHDGQAMVLKKKY